jgi:hypothetical protein
MANLMESRLHSGRRVSSNGEASSQVGMIDGRAGLHKAAGVARQHTVCRAEAGRWLSQHMMHSRCLLLLLPLLLLSIVATTAAARPLSAGLLASAPQPSRGLAAMPASTPSSVARYRPALLLATGAAAAYAAYLVYSTLHALQALPSHGLQRSNAVRRRSRMSSSPPRRLSLGLVHSSERERERDLPTLGEYDFLGTPIALSAHELVTVHELRAVSAHAQPDASRPDVDAAIAALYDTFLDRLLQVLFPHRPPIPREIEAVRGWVGPRLPDTTAVARATERHARAFPPHHDQLAALDGAESLAATDLSWGTDEDTEGDTLDPNGQTLQRTLYHIAEDRARHQGVVHRGITCNACDEKPIRGVRWHCANCVDFDLCSTCEATNSHYKTHVFYKIRVPAPYLGLQKQEPLYPGKPHMMSPSIDSVLKKRLVAETNMEAEEVEGLWDQFSCLAGTEWAGDTTGVGWALDRRAFNHAFVPRYNSFSPAPNLIYDRIFAYYDTDRNGLIGFEEWIKGLDGMHTTDVEVKARIVFNGYDIDGDGYISRKDILRVFRAYYAIEKEATRNYVAELTEELSVRNAADTIRSGQPLGSVFPPSNMATTNVGNHNLTSKPQNRADTTTPVLEDETVDIATREDILTITNLAHITSGDMSEEESGRIIANRWARRQFYVDIEEGLRQPEGRLDPAIMATTMSTNVAEMSEATAAVDTTGMSRSSSRVRFRDALDSETRSNASTSSRPFGERWGGYEMPEPEKDLGKEILYQITQEGFNELLNPLFLDKEDLAMSASETRSERRKHVAAIDELMELFKVVKNDAEAIAKVGIFRYSKNIVDNVCKALNRGTPHTSFKNVFDTNGGSPMDRDEARTRLADVYANTEAALLNLIKTQVLDATDTRSFDTLTLWNTMLCMYQLHDEVLDAILECASSSRWLAELILDSTGTNEVDPVQMSFGQCDPTMPQFRPNSMTDDDDHIRISVLHTRQVVRRSSLAQESSSSEDDPPDLYNSNDETEPCICDPEGPFFILAIPNAMPTRSKEEGKPALTEESSDTIHHQANPIPRHLTESLPLTVEQRHPADLDDKHDPAEKSSSTSWQSYTDDPCLHILRLDDSSGTAVVRFESRPAIHSPNHLLIDPLWSVQRHIRQLAMDPESRLHLTMLTSLEIVEREIGERKGSGLITFEEFAAHIRLGKLRFLESWMEWVSI